MVVHNFGGSSLATAVQDYSDTLEFIKRDDIKSSYQAHNLGLHE